VRSDAVEVGSTFGRLTVVGAGPTRPHYLKTWQVRCACGNERIVDQGNLKSGHTTSCGCASLELTRERSLRYGGSRLPEYLAHQNMIRRCRPDHPQAKDYAGRGIAVAPAMLNFETFFAHVGPRPSPAHTLDRVDNGRGYEAGNLRWATRAEQARNRRRPMRQDALE